MSYSSFAMHEAASRSILLVSYCSDIIIIVKFVPSVSGDRIIVGVVPA